MSGFPKKERQRIIDAYLAATGRNMFQPTEFIDWLEGQPEHEAYEWFFAMNERTAAREYRIGLARQMASGLRISVQSHNLETAVLQVGIMEYPAYISPVAGRKDGGGYVPFNPNDADLMAELRCQGAQALFSWLDRYRSAANMAGIEVNCIAEVAQSMRDKAAKAA